MGLMRLPAMFSSAYGLALDAAWVTLAWSGLDYAIEWRSWNQRLRMSKQEMRDEMRDSMGNPQIKAKIRQIQRAMRKRKVKADMSRASVVITNPTHYAVALEFSFETMSAPTVLAKGRDLLAAEIREEARWAGIPIIENPPLARSLYKMVEPGQSIPFELYAAVAGILAYLYRQKVEERVRRDRQAKERRTEKAQQRGAERSRGSNGDDWNAWLWRWDVSETAVKKMSGFSMAKLQTLLLPVAAISMVFVMIIPVPSMVLDILLAASITASVIVFLTAVQVRRAVDFSVFPTLLLLLTLFRLSLNLASSRRILLHGQEGTHAAGAVIEAFGQFVVGGNYVVGFVLFLALIAIQFLVVSHGAVRTAEVTARFTLDALPGKQMAIDADMNAGLIDEQGARKRRQAIAREAEFYGAMDGAAKFNQRDSLATILITAINIVAGLLIGVLQHGTDLATAVKTYTILTVGDGLVTMIPEPAGFDCGRHGVDASLVCRIAGR